jgi:hypothetical protein
MNAVNDSESPWQQLAPALDDAMNGLTTNDRDVLVLRFFEGHNFRALGAALGTTEDTAQKRVTRALDRLRTRLTRRGVTLSVTALAAVLGTQAVSAAPLGLAANISSVSLTGVCAGGTALTLFKTMTMTQLKTALAGAIVAAGVATPLVLQHQSLNRLREENGALRRQIEQVGTLRAENERLAQSQTDPAERERLRQQQDELLRLRAEVTRLRGQEHELMKLRAAKPPAAAAAAPTRNDNEPETPNHLPREMWLDAGFSIPRAALQTRGWAVQNGNRERFKESVFITDAARKMLELTLEQMIAGAADPEKARQQIQEQGLSLEDGILAPMMAESQKKEYTGYRILSDESPAADRRILEVETEMAAAPAKRETLTFQRFGTDWKVVIDEDFIQARSKGATR